MFGQMAQQIATHSACTRCSLYMRMSLHIGRSRAAAPVRPRQSTEASGRLQCLCDANADSERGPVYPRSRALSIPSGMRSIAYCPADGPTIGQRHRRRRSAVKSTQWGAGMDECLDEMQHDSTSVDDWGVNRDMQKAHRYPALNAFACCSENSRPLNGAGREQQESCHVSMPGRCTCMSFVMMR